MKVTRLVLCLHRLRTQFVLPSLFVVTLHGVWQNDIASHR